MNIYDRKYQVFISSTYTDLVTARNEVIRVLLNLHQLPIGMEMFSADNDEQWTVIQETIDKSDYYILIVGQRYGSLTKEGISYTEKEFDYAMSIGVPIMVFIQDDQVPTRPSERDTEPEKSAKLKDFRAKVAANKMANFWKTEAELAQQVQTALIKSFTRHPRTGWVRADQVASPQVTSELAALSQENRKLKKQVEHFLDLQSNRKPVFELLVNDKDRLQLTYLEDPKQPFELLQPIYSAYDFPSHVKDFYNASEVERYNRQLAEHPEAVEEYNNRMLALNRKINGSVQAVITIHNVGKAKANEIYIELLFPPEVLILKELPSSYAQHKLPEGITQHPIKEAYDTFQRINNRYSPSGYQMNQTISSPAPRYNFSVSENKLTIRHNSLLHTRSATTDGPLFICPIARGTFSVDVSFVCEEYDKALHSQFFIDVI